MISVSIVTYHTPEPELLSCLRCLDSPAVSHIYIIDNASSGATAELVRAMPKVRYIASANVGYGAGHNQALRRELERPSGDYHLVMNSDLTFDPAILGRIEDYMDAHPAVGSLQPLIFSPDGSRQYTCRALPRPIDVFTRRFLPGWFMRRSRERYLLRHLDASRTWNIPYQQGSFMFLRMEALRQCGIFDERFFMYPEDIDLTRRIHRRYLTVQWPGASIIHDHHAASYRSLRMLRIHATNMVRYFNKWGWLNDAERRRFNASIAPVD